MVEVLCGHDKCLEALIQMGANVNKQETFEYNGLCDDKCFDMLAEAGLEVDGSLYDDCTGLHKAAMNGNVKCVGLLIEAGADVNKKDEFHFTVLMWAARNGHEVSLGLLIE